MKLPRPPRRFTSEHALLLGTLGLFVAGSLWVAYSPGTAGAGDSRSWLGGLPGFGLPLVQSLLCR